MADIFDGIEAKIDRAKEHLQLLDGHIRAYLGDDPYRFVAEEHTEGNHYYWAIFVEVTRFPPDKVWGPVIGDAVHNLRSALNHLAWHFALPIARKQDPRRIEYPIFLDNPANNPEVRGVFTKKIQYLRPETHAIIDGTQPYKTGNSHHPLWLLQSMWNIDKHRTLHTAGFLFGIPSDDPTGFGTWHYGPFGRNDPKHRAPLASGRGTVGFIVRDLDQRMDTYQRMAVDVALGSGRSPSPDEPYAGLPIRQALSQISIYVTEQVIRPLRALA